jgi:hypothetical protein
MLFLGASIHIYYVVAPFSFHFIFLVFKLYLAVLLELYAGPTNNVAAGVAVPMVFPR